MIAFLILVGVVGFIGWLIGSAIGYIIGKPFKEEENYTFNSTHIHNHYHEHKNISIIDDETKKKIFELKEGKDEKPS